MQKKQENLEVSLSMRNPCVKKKKKKKPRSG